MTLAAAEERSDRGSRRARVLHEAAKALNRRGVGQTSLADIARNVGVSRAALYYYFDDQEDLVFQCYRNTLERMTQHFSDAVHHHALALEIIDGFAEGILGESEPEFAAISEAASLRDDQRSTILGLYEGLRASITDVIHGGIASGELRQVDARLAASTIIGLISWVPSAQRWTMINPPLNPALLAEISAIVRYGIAGDRSAPSGYVPIELKPMVLPVSSIFDPQAVAEARREALFAAASWLFNLKGVDATPLEEIALRVGITKKSIYHIVDDKRTLVLSCYRRGFRVFEQIAQHIREYDGPRADALTAGAHALTEASLRQDIATLAPRTGHETWSEAETEELNGLAARLRDIYLEAYAQGAAEGTVRGVDARALASLLPGMFEWLPIWFDAFTQEERDAAPCAMADLYRLGLSRIDD